MLYFRYLHQFEFDYPLTLGIDFRFDFELVLTLWPLQETHE